MNQSRFYSIVVWGPIVLFISFLIGCTGDVEEDATVQAIVEQVLSTNTPTAVPTDTPPPPTPTNTAVPPTNTATPVPTDTPVPPTLTPSPTPALMLTFQDQAGDAIICDTRAVSDDAEVDIASIEATVQEDNMLMHILMNSPLQNDFSFAVLVALFSNQNIAAYLWEVHDEELRVGAMDYQTGELLAETGSSVTIEHDRDLGELTFSIPYSQTVTITSTTTISPTTTSRALFVSSFHTSAEGEAKTCDTVGPISLPASPSSSP